MQTVSSQHLHLNIIQQKKQFLTSPHLYMLNLGSIDTYHIYIYIISTVYIYVLYVQSIQSTESFPSLPHLLPGFPYHQLFRCLIGRSIHLCHLFRPMDGWWGPVEVGCFNASNENLYVLSLVIMSLNLAIACF